MLSGQVDPTGQFVASTGTDGFINIYKFTENKDSVQFQTKVKICDKKFANDGTYDLGFQFLQDGETILIPGQKSIGFISLSEDGEWELEH